MLFAETYPRTHHGGKIAEVGIIDWHIVQISQFLGDLARDGRLATSDVAQ